MMVREQNRYWVFQLAGWGVFALINIFFALLFDRFTPGVFQRLLFFVEMGILFSHLMRETIVRANILLKNLQQQMLSFFILTIIFTVLKLWLLPMMGLIA